MKPWIRTTIDNHCEQVIGIQPTPEIDGCIEFYFEEADGTKNSGILYIDKDELPIIIQKMQEMMEYTKK